MRICRRCMCKYMRLARDKWLVWHAYVVVDMPAIPQWKIAASYQTYCCTGMVLSYQYILSTENTSCGSGQYHYLDIKLN
ncbi:Uncharacterised protein [Citrobacter koseri]|nr:Uncharacterised protein [Citrobacter koseri]